jgi:polyisoprenoid-binding protein YceI
MTTILKSGSYAIDPAHSYVEFAVKHLMISTV